MSQRTKIQNSKGDSEHEKRCLYINIGIQELYLHLLNKSSPHNDQTQGRKPEINTLFINSALCSSYVPNIVNDSLLIP